jgi:diguanylate cyclase (GGDEF)-like protein
MTEVMPTSEQQKQRYCVMCLWWRALSHLSKDSRRLAWSGVLLVPIFWLADAFLDVYLFNQGDELHHGLFDLEPVELYMRILISVMFIAFGLYAAFLLNRSEKVERELRSSNDQLLQLKSELERLAGADPLTGAFNRRTFHELLNKTISNAERHDHHFALLMIDVDHFKMVNDTFGHQAGDDVLRVLCDLIGASVRSSDHLFRVGGEEFCLLVTLTDEGEAQKLAEKLHRVVRTHHFYRVGEITVSIGITHFREGDSLESIYARADDAMYEAKRRGRNCIVLHES